MVLIRALLIALTALGATGSVATATSDFDCYPAGPVFKGGRAPLRLRDAHSRRFASALADAADGSVDFGGHYVLAEIGCGSGCITAAVIDAKTGHVFWFPDTISNWPKVSQEPIEYTAASRLIVIHGQLNEKGAVGPHRFIFDGREFVRTSTSS